MDWLLAMFGKVRVGWSWTLPSFMGNDDAERLKIACDEAISRFTANGDKTYCNVGASYICKQMGHGGFDGLLANQIIQIIKTDPNWAIVSGESAQKLADDGKLVIAGIQEEPNGHVAVCYPGSGLRSAKWRGAFAPLLANVGQKNGVIGANYAFRDQPKYWALVA